MLRGWLQSCNRAQSVGSVVMLRWTQEDKETADYLHETLGTEYPLPPIQAAAGRPGQCVKPVGYPHHTLTSTA